MKDSPEMQKDTNSHSEWLRDYYSRITEEYKFSMERKDRVTDWSIGIFFAFLIAYAELLMAQTPSIWRIYLIIGTLCFIDRLFINSCLAYGYLEKWRYLLDLIEKHWMNGNPTIEYVKDKIENLHYAVKTTKGRMYFIRSQLIASFSLLFLFPFVLLLFDSYSTPLNELFVPILFLFAYLVYEAIMYLNDKHLNELKV